MREIYPNPRPSTKQIMAAVSIAQKRGIEIPPIDYMTANDVGKWIRLNSTKKKLISKTTILVYADGTVETISSPIKG